MEKGLLSSPKKKPPRKGNRREERRLCPAEKKPLMGKRKNTFGLSGGENQCIERERRFFLQQEKKKGAQKKRGSRHPAEGKICQGSMWKGTVVQRIYFERGKKRKIWTIFPTDVWEDDLV